MVKRDYLFSIIVPVYNVKEYLTKCIASIINQTYKNLELILVDDGSTDGSSIICDSFQIQDNRIKVIHKKNGGLVSARKAGATCAKGDYILCVDGDDWISSQLFEKAVEVINEFEPDVLCFNYFFWFDEKRMKEGPSFKTRGFLNKQEIENSIYPYLIESKDGECFPQSIWSKLFKRDLYVKYQMMVPNEVMISEDVSVTKPIIYNANTLAVLPECLYYYRFNNSSMTKKKKPFDIYGPKKVGEHLLSFFNDDEMNMQVYRFVVHNLFVACITQFYSSGKESRAIKNTILKAVQDPFYFNCICNTAYSKWYLKGQLAKRILQRKMIWAMKLISRLGLR